MGVEMDKALARLGAEDAIGQLRRREGLMLQLGSEGSEPKLDWVEGVARLLQAPERLEKLEFAARAIKERGIRHIIWSGMGGSVIAVRVVTEMGFCQAGQTQQGIAIYPLDSTDPASLNLLVQEIAARKQMKLDGPLEGEDLRNLLSDVMMVGVSMGMTSEEPITHLNWFADLLLQAGLTASEHLLVMTLPNSYLDQFAKEQQVPSWPLQLDGGNGTGGRMSAPATHVFLLPMALYFASTNAKEGSLQALLRRAWDLYDLDGAAARPSEHAFVRLAAALTEASKDGACQLLLEIPPAWHPLTQWIEQLLEESLGKGGKGVVLFDGRQLAPDAGSRRNSGRLIVQIEDRPATESQSEAVYTIYQSAYASSDPLDRLAALTSSFLNWQLCMAVYGYLEPITFAGQPAVENYKARARKLRFEAEPLRVLSEWSARSTSPGLTLLFPEKTNIQASAAETFADWMFEMISQQHRAGQKSYLDYTFNGEPSVALLQLLNESSRLVGNELLGVPVKVRRAPAAYHASEQSEMDGPAALVSLRIVTRNHQRSLLGSYDASFLLAQAVSTWQAMLEQGRPCALLFLDGTLEEGLGSLQTFLKDVARLLSARVKHTL